MDKELLEKLKELSDKMIDSLGDKLEDKKKMFEEALEQPCKIHIDSNRNGETALNITGSKLSLLVTLAGAENEILKQLHCSNAEFDFIKNIVHTKEADDNE